MIEPTPVEVAKFWPKVRKTDSCWEWIGSHDRHGYGRVRKHRSMNSAHRFMWQISNGPIPIGLCVCHRCDNPGCINPDHLFLGTHDENMKDRRSKGRWHDLAGERNGRAKLKLQDVLMIHKMSMDGGSSESIGASFGISAKHVKKILVGDRWPHVLAILDKAGAGDAE